MLAAAATPANSMVPAATDAGNQLYLNQYQRGAVSFSQYSRRRVEGLKGLKIKPQGLGPGPGRDKSAGSRSGGKGFGKGS